MWYLSALFLGQLLVTVADELLQIHALQNDSVILNCTAQPQPGVDYSVVRWYKEGVSPRLSGLLSKELPNGRMRWYVGASSLTSVKDPYDLLLPNISCSQSGVYQCHLSAPVGERNREGRVRLTITDCPSEDLEDSDYVDYVDYVDFEMHMMDPGKPTSGRPTEGYLVLFGAVGALTAALVILFISYRSLTKTLWTTKKTPLTPLSPNPLCPSEKQGLLPIYSSPPKNSPPITV